MTALVRRPETQTLRHDDLVTVPADILDRNRLAESMTGCDAVVSAVGIGTSRAPTVIYSEGITNVLGAMQANEITRLAVVSAAPAAPRAGQPFLERRIMMPVLERFFGDTYDDMRRMESILQASDVDWVVLRPATPREKIRDRWLPHRRRTAVEGEEAHLRRPGRRTAGFARPQRLVPPLSVRRQLVPSRTTFALPPDRRWPGSRA